MNEDNNVSRLLNNIADIGRENRIQHILGSYKTRDEVAGEKTSGRLATFKISTWFAISEAFWPDICARFGWVNSEINTALCEVCKNQLQLDENEPAEKFHQKLNDSHKKLCPWLQSVSPPTFSLFPVQSREQTKYDFINRLKPLLSIPLPNLDPRFLQTLEKHSISVQNILKLANSELSSETPITSDKACLLALCGWEFESNRILCCRYCQRNLGLWNFENQSLHPIEEHRAFCIWVTERSRQDSNQIVRQEEGGWLKSAQQLTSHFVNE